MTPYEHAWRAMEPFLDRLAAKPEVVGVAVLCNAALPTEHSHFDAHSDFDLAVVISVPTLNPADWAAHPSQAYLAIQDSLPQWLPNFGFKVDCPYGPLEVNVNQLILEYERDPRTTWDLEKCDAYASKCRIIHDPAGRLRDLIDQKTAAARLQFPALIRRLAFRLTWDVQRVPLLAASRGGNAVGHHLVNNAIEELIELVYLLHGRFIAARKWRLLSLREFDLLPASDYDTLRSIIVANGPTAEDLDRRIRGLVALWESLKMRFRLPSTNEIQRQYLSKDVQLLRCTTADAVSISSEPGRYDRANFELRSTPYGLPGQRAAGHATTPAASDAVKDAEPRPQANACAGHAWNLPTMGLAQPPRLGVSQTEPAHVLGAGSAGPSC